MTPYTYHRVLVAVDGSEGSDHALECALSLCAAMNAELTALAVEGKLLGHRGHFLGDYLLGSTADRVAHHAHCPVIVVR